MKIQLKFIEAEDCIPLRHLVLRNNQSIKTCIFSGDELESTLHLGAFFNQNLIGIVSVLSKNKPDFHQENQYQLRGMAIHPNFQANGVGRKLLQHILSHLAQLNVDLCWCNARIHAVDFYQKEGFQIHGSIFEIQEVGPHFLMSIELNNKKLKA